jgi:hypothetical protein
MERRAQEPALAPVEQLGSLLRSTLAPRGEHIRFAKRKRARTEPQPTCLLLAIPAFRA